MRVEFTHKGFFGLCPVHFAGLDTDAPVIHPRNVLLSPLFWLSELVFVVAFLFIGAFRPEWEPEWPLQITGELPRPLVRVFPDVPETR